MSSPPLLPHIKAGIDAVYRQIDEACMKHGRDPREVTLCLATKTRAIEEVKEAWSHCRGVPVMGENQVQTAVQRVEEGVMEEEADRHFIGHLQSNKINQILTFADCIQTVDTEKLAEKLESRLAKLDKTLRIYVQVNTSGEEQKSGCDPSSATHLATSIAKSCPHLKVEGLMTIGINSPDQDRVAACFRTLKNLQKEINEAGCPEVSIKHLSMGMSGDLELAIQEGSTMVRVGTAIFGQRDYGKKE